MNINSNSKSTRSGAKGINKSLTDECDPAGSHSSAAALWLLNAHARAWLVTSLRLVYC